MEPTTKCIAFISELEGSRLVSYKDRRGIWTIGCGHRMLMQGSNCEGVTITPEQEMMYLKGDLEAAAHAVNSVGVPLTQNQFDALVSFAFNLGFEHFMTSECVAALRRGDYDGAADDILHWNHVNGVPDDILTKRRNVERLLFLTKDDDEPLPGV